MAGEQQTLKPNRPTHGAYIVEKKPNAERGFWHQIGAAWVHRDGKGFSIDLFAMPTKGQRIELRMIDRNKSAAGADVPEEPEDY